MNICYANHRLRLVSIYFWTLITAFICNQCASTNQQTRTKKGEPVTISENASVEEVVNAAVSNGGNSIKDARRILTRTKNWSTAEKLLTDILANQNKDIEDYKLVHAMSLYLSGPLPSNPKIFKALLQSSKPSVRQIGWQMAANMPSKQMQKALEVELNRALLDEQETDLFIPQVALALQANRMIQSYSLVREGLFQTGHEEFAHAMATLDPKRATDDFLDYLAICPPEELRQLTLSSVNLYSATIALTHIRKHLPKATDPKIEIIIYYAVSRNPGLSELGNSIVDSLITQDKKSVAIRMSRIPSWAQISFIENSRRTMNAVRRVFLNELKSVSAQNDVLDEIAETKL
jgi:hypothetical protein